MNNLKMNRCIVAWIICTLLVILTDSSKAQVVNVERHRVAADTVGLWTGGLGFGLNVSKNKTQVTRFNNSADLAYIARKHDFLLLGRNNFLRVKGDNVHNDGFIHFRSVLFRDNRWAPELFLQAQYNMDWGLHRRALAGSNLRIRISESGRFSAFVSTGLMYENELWKESENERQFRTIKSYVKSTTSVNIRGQVSESLSLAAISYYQARPADFFKPRFTSDWQFRFRISERLGFAVQLVSTLDSEPVLDVTKFVYNINNLLEVRF